MAKIIDPDNLSLTLGVQSSEEVVISTANRTIELTDAGTSTLDNDGVTGQCLYSFLKEEWRTDSTLSKYPFPMVSVTEESFEFVDGWKPKDETTVKFLRDCGFAIKNTSGVIVRKDMGIISLGAFAEATDQAYFQQEDGGDPTDTHIAGEMNECIQIYGDADNGNFDYTDFFNVLLREQAKTYRNYDLITQQSIAELSYKLYKLPLENSSDALKITHSDAVIAVDAPYTGISITYYAIAQSKPVGSSNYNFDKIITCNGGTLEQIYEKVQYLLRQSEDIDSGAGTVRGDTADSLLYFVGNELYCETGVYLEGFSAVDTNRHYPKDTSGIVRAYPYVAAGTISFNTNFANDADTVYRVYITNDDVGDNTGRDYRTDNAMLLNDASGTPISGDLGGASEVTFDIDFDGNVQRGASSAGTNIPYTAVAIGLKTGKFAVATGNITRSTTNVINLSGELERAYLNP